MIPGGAPEFLGPLTFECFNSESPTLPIAEGFLDFHKGSLDAQNHDRLTGRQASAEETDGRTFVRGRRPECGRPRAARESHRYREGRG
jgi:hypothetical protein